MNDHNILLTEWIRKELISQMEERETPFSFGDIQRGIQAEALKQIGFAVSNYAKMFEVMA